MYDVISTSHGHTPIIVEFLVLDCWKLVQNLKELQGSV